MQLCWSGGGTSPERNHHGRPHPPKRKPCSISLRGIELSVLVASEQLLQDFMVHGEQLAVALVQLLALSGQLANLLPMPTQGLAALARAPSQQALHARRSGFLAKGGQHLAEIGRAHV